MAVKRRHTKSTQRKPFWERLLEWILSALKRLLLPAFVVWLIGWLWLGGVFEKTANMAWDNFVGWSADKDLVVKDVVIEGRDRTSINALKNAINVDVNDPLLSVDIDKIQNRLSDLPWVKHVSVGRQYNGLINIQITERVPFVVWDRDGRAPVVVDSDGDVIPHVSIQNFKNLLIVHGVDEPKHASDLMRIIIAEPAVAKHIKGAEWIGDRRWDLITANRTKIHLPADDIGYALSRLAKAQEDKKILSRPLLSIDLRGKDRIIVEAERGQSTPL